MPGGRKLGENSTEAAFTAEIRRQPFGEPTRTSLINSIEKNMGEEHDYPYLN
jgi:hypothetical protein